MHSPPHTLNSVTCVCTVQCTHGIVFNERPFGTDLNLSASFCWPMKNRRFLHKKQHSLKISSLKVGGAHGHKKLPVPWSQFPHILKPRVSFAGNASIGTKMEREARFVAHAVCLSACLFLTAAALPLSLYSNVLVLLYSKQIFFRLSLNVKSIQEFL